MSSRPPLRLSAFLPVLPASPGPDTVRAGVGAGFGIGLCTAVAMALPALGALPVLLVAPLGASAVLIFAMPNAPLAQPWSAVIGNTISALVAILLLSLCDGPSAAALAVASAILAMLLVRALHPPGGAVALLITLDPAAAIALGPAFALVPVGLMTAVLVAGGVVFHRFSGRVYPFRQTGNGPDSDVVPRMGLSEEELAGLLGAFRQSTNIGVADLGRLMAAAEEEAAMHRFDTVTCGAIMTRDLVTVDPGADVREAARLFRRHRIKSLPVVGNDGTFHGVILQTDIIDALAGMLSGPRLVGRASRMRAGQVARPVTFRVAADMPVGLLINRLALQGTETVPVMDEGRLAGIITRSDVMRLLLRRSERRLAA